MSFAKRDRRHASGIPETAAADVLPLPPVPSASVAGRTMQESVYKRRVQPRRLPDDAPNILIVLIDDAGPGLPSTFGGEVHTPASTESARRASPTTDSTPRRCARRPERTLLTGTEPPSRRRRTDRGNGERLGRVSGVTPQELRDRCGGASALRLHGGAWGKWHNTPAEQTTAAGPFESWPTGFGFEYFYGFLAGEASQYEPNLVRNTTYVAPPRTPKRAIT